MDSTYFEMGLQSFKGGFSTEKRKKKKQRKLSLGCLHKNNK